MSDEHDKPHVYGGPDEARRDPGPEQGGRGERTFDPDKGPEFAHDIVAPDGSVIPVVEENGVAFAEIEGNVGATTNDANSDAEGPDATPADDTAPPAFARPVDRANFDHTRDAGPENIRDESSRRDWDAVDENADESFPASDPPSY